MYAQDSKKKEKKRQHFQEKQSTLFFKDITCIAERTDNHNIFVGTAKGSVYEILEESLLCQDELMYVSVLHSIHNCQISFMVICTHNDFLFSASKDDGVILLICLETKTV